MTKETDYHIPVTDSVSEEYDWRVLPVLKDRYVKSVFHQVEDFPMSSASDHYITSIERFWFLKIDEEIAVDMILHDQYHDLNVLIQVSLVLGHEKKSNEWWDNHFAQQKKEENLYVLG